MITLHSENVVIAKSSYCFWPAWLWRQRHYNPSKCLQLLAQQHSITHSPANWNIFCTRFLLAENIKIPCLGCDGVLLNRRGCLRGRNHLHLPGQHCLHTITPQQTVTHTISTILPVLFKACCILIMEPYVCLQSHNTVVCFYLFLHTVLRYFYHQYMSLYIFFTSWNYASSLPNAYTVSPQFIFQLSSKPLTYRYLVRPLRS